MEVNMIDLKSFMVNDTFFGARNSHDGFRSMFGEIFAPNEYERLFILKGGPGTGKSTLLRGLVSFANEVGINASAVLCSSDVTSLDGVILEHKGKRIAVIDGTAPHTQDPAYPGAIDEIVNLGDGFDNSLLVKRKEEILLYSKEKSKGYKKAYRTLFAAKAVFECIWNELRFSGFYNEAEKLAKQILKEANIGSGSPKRCSGLYSAFGKSGQYRLPPTKEKRVSNIFGNEILCAIVLDEIKRRCERKDIQATRYPTALDDRIAERVYVGDCVIIFGKDAEQKFELGDYCADEYCTNFSVLYSQYTALLDIAKSHFSSAAAAHLMLEKIYSSGIDFSNNDKVYRCLCDRIYDILI